ncbi:MAG: peroxide stress protein YaaA [Hyphomonadaceae bacterium]
MLILLSPAKNLNYEPVAPELPATKPRLEADIAALAKVTAKLKRSDIAKLMHLSDNLAELNYQRFQAFDPALDGPELLQAALAFNGDVYQGLQARDLSAEDLTWAQDHVRILSGLYGLLRPLDVIAPYRLEMGTRLKTKRGESLYDFWGDRLSKAINADLAGQSAPIVLNLASTEYFSAVSKKALKARVITANFKEIKDGEARVLSFYAKRARGAMARFCIENRIPDPEGIKAFDLDGYRFDAASSKPDTWVFSRPQPPGKMG